MSERWVWNERRKRREKRPKDECPHCGRYDLVTVRRWDGPGLIVSLICRLRGTEKPDGRTVYHTYCGNCGFRGPEWEDDG